jgi:hypothetical protein
MVIRLSLISDSLDKHSISGSSQLRRAWKMKAPSRTRFHGAIRFSCASRDGPILTRLTADGLRQLREAQVCTFAGTMSLSETLCTFFSKYLIGNTIASENAERLYDRLSLRCPLCRTLARL